MYISTLIKKQYKEIIRSSDKRVNLISELIQGILAVKTFCWEDAIEKNINALRKIEHKYLKKIYIVKSINFMVAISISSVISFLTFTYLWSQKISFDLPVAIYTISLLFLPKMTVCTLLPIS